jgi:AcrR family transcriptional regulator
MARIAPADERREARRDAIVDAARLLFSERGLEKTTMRAIADELGMTTGALFVHFPDKDSILREVCLRDFRTLRQSFEKAAHVVDPVERIRQIGRSYVGFALEHPNHYRLLFLTPHPPELEPPPDQLQKGNPDQDAYAFLRQTVAQAIEQGRFRPELDDPDLLAQMLWSGVHGTVALELTHSKDAWVDWRPIASRTELMVDVTLRGLLREPNPRRKPRGKRHG